MTETQVNMFDELAQQFDDIWDAYVDLVAAATESTEDGSDELVSQAETGLYELEALRDRYNLAA